ncbi:hypothetical protein [Planktotalea arctica]|uniref:hypothetical protein n=1 Tax=Planktotalea arctica TaxID=1481893 RepID=UPI000A177945|nr:hypothetical protein [Planktotalea arctica]
MSDVMTFGQGRHRCIGETLGIAQLTAMMRAIVELGIRPAAKAMTYQSRIGHRWPDEMIVKIK